MKIRIPISKEQIWIYICIVIFAFASNACQTATKANKTDTELHSKTDSANTLPQTDDSNTASDSDTESFAAQSTESSVTKSTESSVTQSTESSVTQSTESSVTRYVDELSGNESPPAISWIKVESGSFIFGSPPDAPCSFPSEEQVSVTLTRSFQIAATEVTQAQWEALDLPHASWTKGAEMPVTLINFFEAAAWCNKLSRLENLEPCYDLGNCENEIGDGCINNEGIKFPSCGSSYEFAFRCTGNIHRFPDRYSCPGYRLPTSAEWEYAAKADVTETHTYGGDLHADIDISACSEQPALEDIAWYCHNSGGEVHPVAQKQPNPWGLYDTLGNVQEWTDFYFSGGVPYRYENSDTTITDPIGPESGSDMETRGRFFTSTGCLLRPTSRIYAFTDARSAKLGFRPVRTILE
ncbi:MAG: formylglycine-generating enzyme family protein [Proteobacteria bacterium]|nr:formylglycine-generating enzyme family protein [Pseudomonadota bacterium]